MNFGTALAPGDYYAIVSDMKSCEKCGGPHVATFSVGRTGYSCGSGHKCAPECPTLRCAHGVLWAEDCPACDAVEELNYHGEVD